MKCGHTLVEIVLILILVGLAAAILISTLTSVQEKSCRVSCRGDLDILGKIMKVYLLDYGRNVLYPQVEGEEFLVVLYHTELLDEPTIYLCPTTIDTNNEGADLVNVLGTGDTDGPCSYAGRKNTKQQEYPGIFKPQKDTTISPMAADDWDAKSKPNHLEEHYFLFLDGHVDHFSYPINTFAQLFDPLTN